MADGATKSKRKPVTFSPSEEQLIRIDNEREWLRQVISGGYDPRGYGLHPSMMIGEGTADVYLALCGLWNQGVQPADARYKRSIRLVAKSSGMAAEHIEHLLEPGPTAHADYLADKIREAATAEDRARIAAEIHTRSQRGDDTSELVEQLRELEPQTDSSGVVSFCDLLSEHSQLHEIVIDGFLRRGETANLIAPPKRGKSWLVLGLAFAVAEGRKWLGCHCRKGRVLIVDAELHPATITHRMRTVADAIQADPKTEIDVLPLRGQNCDLPALAVQLEGIRPGAYELIVLDALYRFLPQGTSENDNAAMMAIYNQIDQIAKGLQCAVVIIHHTSKGSQADKAVTDIGSGAGSISRAADTHITIRDHSDPNYQILEAVTRSFPSPDPKTVYFEWPLWRESDLQPEAKAARVPQSDKRDRETREAILRLVTQAGGRAVTYSKLRERTGYGWQRIARGVALLEEAGEAKRARLKSKRGGKPADAVRLAEKSEA